MKTIEEQIREALKKTTTYSFNNGWNNSRSKYGYQQLNLNGIKILEADRDSLMRANKINEHCDLMNKKVLDCCGNIGLLGMHLIEKYEGESIFFDFDGTAVEAGNLIAKLLDKNVKGFQWNADENSYDDLKNKVGNPDVILLCSIGSWVKSWEKLYQMVIDLSPETIILETNNDSEGKPQINFFRNKGLNPTIIIDNSQDDSTGNNKRKTYIINSRKKNDL